MIQLQDIISAYLVARQNKRRSPDQVEFEIHWQRNCLKLYDDIVRRQLRPTAYTFVASHPRPREVFASDMSTRILHHYIDMKLRPFLEARMSPHTYNNRVGLGQSACQNAVISDIYEMSAGFTQDAWIIKLDMSGCFPNIRQDTAYAQLLEVLLTDYEGPDKDELIYILQVCIFSYPTHHCYRKSSMEKWNDIPKEKSLFSKPDGIGAAIGHLIWQNAVNYYFHELDEWADSIPEIRYERFVDDIYIVARSKTALLLIPQIRQILEGLGAKLHPHKFYCQHYTKGVECLGVHIKMDRVYPNERSIRRAIQKARTFNACPRPEKIDDLLASLNSYLGICKNLNGYNQARRIYRELDPKWAEFVHFNSRRVCLQANEGYKHNQLLTRKYNL